MNRQRILNFQEGLNEIIQRILDSNRTPVLVGIHGVPHVGKTHLRKILTNELWEKYKRLGWSGVEGDSLEKCGKLYIPDPQYHLIEDTSFRISVDRYMEKHHERQTDISIYMTRVFTPELNEVKDDFDILIENPEANSKTKI